MIYWLLLSLLLLGGLVCAPATDAVEPICPGGASPRADIVWCSDLENYNDAACQSDPSSKACWVANNWTREPTNNTSNFGTPIPLANRWQIGAHGTPAVGTGYLKLTPMISSVGTGTSFFCGANVECATRYSAVNYRYYRKFEGGRLMHIDGGHGGDLDLVSAGGANSGSFRIQNSLNFNMYHTGNCGGSYFLYPNQPNSPVVRLNRWHMIEMYGKVDTECPGGDVVGGCNGVFKLWVDNVLVSDYNNVNYGGTFKGCLFNQQSISEHNHFGYPAWGTGSISYDNLVYAGVTSGDTLGQIGHAANDCFALGTCGTADLISPYGQSGSTVNSYHGHLPAPDCDTYPHAGDNFIGTLFGARWRGNEGELVTEDLGHPVVRGFIDRCTPSLATILSASRNNAPLNSLWTINNGLNSTDCTTGGGSTLVTCRKNSATVATYTAVPLGTDGSHKIEITSSGTGKGLSYSLSLVFPRPVQEATWQPVTRSNHGWIYIPSGSQANFEGATSVSLAGFVTAQANFDNYVAMSMNGGNWAVRQRIGAGTPATVATSSVPVTYDTWHEFEIIIRNDVTDKVSLMIDRVWVIENQNLLGNVTDLFYTPPTTSQSRGVTGMIDYQGPVPVTVYYDDASIGTASFWDCTGWDPASCPFAGAFRETLRIKWSQ